MAELSDRIRGFFKGVLIGDALGQPVETMWPHSIMMKNGGPITGFVAPLQTKIPENQHLSAGDWTDDLEGTICVAESIIEKKEFSLFSQAKRHVALFESDHARGMGKTTRESLLSLALYFQSNGEKGRSPHQPPPDIEGEGDGCGVAMKIMPLGIWSALTDKCDDHRLMQDVAQLAYLTHSKPKAIVSAFALALAAKYITQSPITGYEDALGMLERMIEPIEKFEKRISAQYDNPMTPVCQIRKIQKCLGNREKLFETFRPSFLAIEGVFLALGMALNYYDSFPACVLFLVNEGGDTDTIASMAGGLVGLNRGIDEIPLKWREFRPDYDQTDDVAARFLAAANK
jgi:ADP-ribosylglycohydrolase